MDESRDMDNEFPPVRPIEKPSIGLKPKKYHDDERHSEILGAINRYLIANKQIPIEWIEEYNELLSKNK